MPGCCFKRRQTTAQVVLHSERILILPTLSDPADRKYAGEACSKDLVLDVEELQVGYEESGCCVLFLTRSGVLQSELTSWG